MIFKKKRKKEIEKERERERRIKKLPDAIRVSYKIFMREKS